MKKQLPAFAAGVLTATLIGTLVVPTLANTITSRTTIEVDPINVMVNGEVFQPTDVNGDPVAVFLYQGTTYAPLRALAEAYGLNVGYDSERNMATVTSTIENVQQQNESNDDNDDDYNTFRSMIEMWYYSRDAHYVKCAFFPVRNSYNDALAKYLKNDDKNGYMERLAKEIRNDNSKITSVHLAVSTWDIAPIVEKDFQF